MYRVSITDAEPQFDSMPVLKTVVHPWATGSFRPLCYLRAAFVRGAGLDFDLTAFEREPAIGAEDMLDDSCVAFCVRPYPKTSPSALLAIFNSGVSGALYLTTGGWENAEKLDAPLFAERYAGADEQGWYWGVRSLFSNELLQELYGRHDVPEGHMMQGNVYKFLRAGKGSHLAMAADGGLMDFICASY